MTVLRKKNEEESEAEKEHPLILKLNENVVF